MLSHRPTRQGEETLTTIQRFRPCELAMIALKIGGVSNARARLIEERRRGGVVRQRRQIGKVAHRAGETAIVTVSWQGQTPSSPDRASNGRTTRRGMVGRVHGYGTAGGGKSAFTPGSRRHWSGLTVRFARKLLTACSAKAARSAGWPYRSCGARERAGSSLATSTSRTIRCASGAFST